MAARLGRVLYWAGCIVAGALLALAGVILAANGFVVSSEGGWLSGLAGGVALAAWLSGRALRYILAGE